jgi:hypothetical protein
MSEDDLNNWLQDNINASVCDEEDIDDYEKEWDELEDYDC